jgi:CRP-like cAMP-binding protein
MSATKRIPATNLLLASLPRKEYQSFLARCHTVELVSSEILGESGKRVRYVYFPVNSFISLVAPIDSQDSMEVGMVGNEGMLGLNLALGVKFSLLRALVQGAGTALRMDADQFLQIYEKSAILQQKLKAYAYVRMTQLSQTAGCNRFHVVEARLARWILMTRDCAHSNEFHITHEFLSYMLGVRRAGITESAGMLQKKKLISYSRGHLKILDRSGLETAACGCYQASKETYKKILG